MSRAIINVAFSAHYPQMQTRLVKSLRYYATEIERCFWTNQVPLGCAPQERIPYAFKGAAMKAAVSRSYTTLLWLDAVMVALQPVAPVMELIEDRGYLLWHHPLGEWTVGAYTSDDCLAYYKISREDAFKIPMLCSGVFGYSLAHPMGRQLHEAFIEAPAIALQGAGYNQGREVSNDKRVLGHRHDQSVLSILAHRLGLVLSPTPTPVAFTGHVAASTVFVHRPRMTMG